MLYLRDQPVPQGSLVEASIRRGSCVTGSGKMHPGPSSGSQLRLGSPIRAADSGHAFPTSAPAFNDPLTEILDRSRVPCCSQAGRVLGPAGLDCPMLCHSSHASGGEAICRSSLPSSNTRQATIPSICPLRLPHAAHYSQWRCVPQRRPPILSLVPSSDACKHGPL